MNGWVNNREAGDLRRYRAHYDAIYTPDSKVHGAIMGPTLVLSPPDGPHVGPMSLAIRDSKKIDVVILLLLIVRSPQMLHMPQQHK